VNGYQKYLSLLPSLRHRKIVFDELEKLFRNHLWLGFYALALPQIEGIFNEMNILSPSIKNSSNKALSQKVELMRPYFNLSDVYFDYYQYIIPDLRNKFTHSGFDANFELNSLDLLVDITFLLRIFTELDFPNIVISKFHKDCNYKNRYLSFEDFFYSYLLNLEKLTNKIKKEMNNDINIFLNTLFEDENIIKIYMDVVKYLPIQIDNFTGFKYNLSNINKNRNRSRRFG
jgi:hypothetical protein